MKTFIRDLVCRIRYLFGGPSVVWKIFTRFVAFLGALVTTFEILNTLYKDNLHFDYLVDNFFPICGVLLGLSLLCSLNYSFHKDFSIDGCDAKITIKIGNIVNEHNSFVVSTNTSFITTRETGFISKKSVQGQFEDKYYHNNLTKLDSLISDSLKSAKPAKQIKINNKNYPVYLPGTIAQIREEEQSIYFLALNDINESGQNSSRKIEDYYNAIAKLWNYIEEHGHTDDLAIPLIGSGRAGIENLTKEKVAFDLIDTFITQSINKKICTRLIIYIHPSDLETLDVKKLFEYTSYKTKYIREKKDIINQDSVITDSEIDDLFDDFKL